MQKKYDIISIDPLLLFLRIMIKVNSNKQFKQYFEYLYHYTTIPLSLFDESYQMRKSRRSIFYDLFPTKSNTFNVLEKDVTVVINGGFLDV